MPTTTNFGWTTPADTDLVKDGAAAIRTLGSGVDTSFVDLKGGTTGQVLSKTTNTDLDFTWITPASGDLVLLNTTSFSAVSSQSISDVFSTTYNNYKILLKGTTTGNTAINFRMRVSGADATGANYTFQTIDASGSNIVTSQTASATSANFAALATDMSNAQMMLFSPFLAEATSFHTLSAFNVGGARYYQYAGSHSLATSYTGLTIATASGSMTGTISIYGFKK